MITVRPPVGPDCEVTHTCERCGAVRGPVSMPYEKTLRPLWELTLMEKLGGGGQIVNASGQLEDLCHDC